MTLLQTGIYAAIYTFVMAFVFVIFDSEIHFPSQAAGAAFVFILIELDKHYGRKREIARREWIDEEYEKRFGVKNEPEPDEGGPI